MPRKQKMRYANMVNMYESLGWTVEETDTGIAVMAGPVDPESGAGFIRIDTAVGPMDDRKVCLEQCAKALADQMLVATWSVVCKEAKPDRVPADTKPEAEQTIATPLDQRKLVLPFAVPTEVI